MIFSKRNLFVITITAFIISDMTTDAVDDIKKTAELSTSAGNLNTSNAILPVLKTSIVKADSKYFYLETFFKANWYKALEFCTLHGMKLASITNKQQNDDLVAQFKYFGYGEDSHFWTSGNDLSKQDNFVWLGNGQQFQYTNWLDGEPNNTTAENEKKEDCVEYWHKGKEGFKWNDQFCSVESYFICELYD